MATGLGLWTLSGGDGADRYFMWKVLEGRRRRGRQDEMDMSLSTLQEIVKDSTPWTGMLQSMGWQRVGHDLVTE